MTWRGRRSGALLDVGVGVPLWEDVGVFLPEHVADSAAGEDLQAAAALPHSEGDLCTPATDSHINALPLTGRNLQRDPPAGGRMG